jgi:hypothetical protein
MARCPPIIAVQQEPAITSTCALYARHERMVVARLAETLQMLRAAAGSGARTIHHQGEALAPANPGESGPGRRRGLAPHRPVWRACGHAVVLPGGVRCRGSRA